MCTEIEVYYKGKCAHRKMKPAKIGGCAQKIGDIIRESVHIEKEERGGKHRLLYLLSVNLCYNGRISVQYVRQCALYDGAKPLLPFRVWGSRG